MGVVHHSVYAIWMEAARVAFLSQAGLDYAEIERLGYAFPVVGLEVAYRTAARFGDVVEVITRLDELKSRSLGFKYRMERNGVLVALGHTRHLVQDHSGRAARIPEALMGFLLASKAE